MLQNLLTQYERPIAPRRRGAVAVIVVGASLFTAGLDAQESTSRQEEEIRALKRRLEQLEQEVSDFKSAKPASTSDSLTNRPIGEPDQDVKSLERNRELEAKAGEARSRETPRFAIGEKGFSFSSADTNFTLQLKGVLQVDTRTFLGDAGIVGNDGILLRRARPILQGTLFRDFSFLFVPDFGGAGAPQIFDAALNCRYSDAVQLMAGKFKTPVGLEQLQADRDLLFNERALPTDLVPNRDIGFELHGDVAGGVVSYAVGIFNGLGDGRNSNNADIEDNKAFAGRIFLQPFSGSSRAALRGLGFGLSGSYEDLQRTNTAALPLNNGYATPAQQQFFVYRNNVVASGNHWRLSPQGYYYFGPFSLLGEYVISDQLVATVGAPGSPSAHVNNTAWQVAAGWVLTGEDATFNTLVPRRNFNPRAGGWGALQLVARFSRLDIDPAAFRVFADPAVSARSAREWAVALNWYLNRNVRLGVSFSHVNFDGGGGPSSSAPAVVTRKDENTLFTRLQLAF